MAAKRSPERLKATSALIAALREGHAVTSSEIKDIFSTHGFRHKSLMSHLFSPHGGRDRFLKELDCDLEIYGHNIVLIPRHLQDPEREKEINAAMNRIEIHNQSTYTQKKSDNEKFNQKP